MTYTFNRIYYLFFTIHVSYISVPLLSFSWLLSFTHICHTVNDCSLSYSVIISAIFYLIFKVSGTSVI